MKAGVMIQYVKTVDVDKLFRKYTDEYGNDTTDGKNTINPTLNSMVHGVSYETLCTKQH